MAQEEGTLKPDFRNGFPIGDVPDGGMVSGQADGEDVILVRRGRDLFAIGELYSLPWPARRRSARW